MKKNVKKAKLKVPFFAHILSRQELQLTHAGKAYATAKSPSDKDETTLSFLDTANPPEPGPPTPPAPPA